MSRSPTSPWSSISFKATEDWAFAFNWTRRHRLRQRAWLVPAYTFPPNREDLSVLRIVVRSGMTLEMADLLREHLREQTEGLESLDGPLPDERPDHRQAFSHN